MKILKFLETSPLILPETFFTESKKNIINLIMPKPAWTYVYNRTQIINKIMSLSLYEEREVTDFRLNKLFNF